MINSKLVKKSIIYFLPVILSHIIFTLTDKNIQLNSNSIDIRLSIVHLSIYFYFFVIPIYLMIVNVVYNAKKEIKIYYNETRFGVLSILGANIAVLIINIISFYIVKLYDINFMIEFFIILIPELIMFAMISFLGSYLVKKQDEDYEEEILEGLKIPKREIEFYKRDEIYDDYENKDDELIEEEEPMCVDNESKRNESEYNEKVLYEENNIQIDRESREIEDEFNEIEDIQNNDIKEKAHIEDENIIPNVNNSEKINDNTDGTDINHENEEDRNS